MDITELVGRDGIAGTLHAADKAQALAELAARAAALGGLAPQTILDALMARERLGSTAMGQGIAIPHARLSPGPRCIYGVFARLAKPLPFDAVDDAPVDLLLLLVGPEGAGSDYLQALACAARLLRDPERAARLRRAEDSALYAALTGPPRAG
jgi:PTS system nitrogen regulatory IIA component